MKRTRNRLTQEFVDTAPGERRFADGEGLYLETLRNSKRWVFRFRWYGKQCELSLGTVSRVSLATARRLADKQRKLLGRDINPIVNRKAEKERARRKFLATQAAEKQIVTFGQFAAEYITSVEQGWRNEKHRQQWHNSLRDHAANLKDIPVDEIDTDHVLAALRPIWLSKAETAGRVRSRIERILNAAKAMGLRPRDSFNPAAWAGHLEVLLPRPKKLTRGHHAAMPYHDLPDFMARVRERQATAARALEFLILGASRSGEVLGARAREIDLDGRRWTVPAERMKAGVAHTVALTPRMVAILNELEIGKMKPDAYVFGGAKPGRPLSGMCMTMLLRRMKLGHLTVHGFRSSFKDWAINETEIADEISEEALAHVVGSKVRRAYRRSRALDRQRQLMEAWHDYCAGENDVPKCP